MMNKEKQIHSSLFFAAIVLSSSVEHQTRQLTNFVQLFERRLPTSLIATITSCELQSLNDENSDFIIQRPTAFFCEGMEG